MPGVLDDPAVMTIVHALGDSSVVLRCYGWVDQRQNSFFKVRSEAIRRVKEAFDQAGIVMPEPCTDCGLLIAWTRVGIGRLLLPCALEVRPAIRRRLRAGLGR